MINLEWLRTFRAVYITKSLSRAAETLMISQPTVSQQISSLESRLGQKLFNRKSKGVVETDFGRMLNTMLSGAMETLEDVELSITKKDSKLKNITSIGISVHIYKTLLCPKVLELGEFVHIKFGTRNELVKDVEEGRLLYAVIPDNLNTFDTICNKIREQKILLVGTPDIDFNHYKKHYKTDKQKAQEWLMAHRWYSHDINSNFIKIYWMSVFDKKRPSIVPNYIIPNEYEVLFQQSQGSGLSVAFDTTVEPFLKDGTLQTCEVKEVVHRELSLISNKRKADPELTEKIVRMLSK
jgi:DNA-binding transcriptional LysR family regulator